MEWMIEGSSERTMGNVLSGDGGGRFSSSLSAWRTRVTVPAVKLGLNELTYRLLIRFSELLGSNQMNRFSHRRQVLAALAASPLASPMLHEMSATDRDAIKRENEQEGTRDWMLSNP